MSEARGAALGRGLWCWLTVAQSQGTHMPADTVGAYGGWLWRSGVFSVLRQRAWRKSRQSGRAGEGREGAEGEGAKDENL